VLRAVRADASVVYKVGGEGQAGGLVFYDKGVFSDGWRYLEAAPYDSGPAEWGLYERSVTGTGVEVGKGKVNTQLIMSKLRESGETGRAAQLCSALNGNGYSDWFLPSKDELHWLYLSLKKNGLGGLSDKAYWSSSEDNNDHSWYERFSDGVQTIKYLKYYYNKSTALSVRAIRAF